LNHFDINITIVRKIYTFLKVLHEKKNCWCYGMNQEYFMELILVDFSMAIPV